MADFLKVKDVATQFGVKPSTVRRWLRSGYMPAARNPGRRATYRISQETVDRFLADRDMDAAQAA